tara:strand:+ start:828 stop:941 length:114 start_codon:yes stop_codon:yes gene_type:complete
MIFGDGANIPEDDTEAINELIDKDKESQSRSQSPTSK